MRLLSREWVNTLITSVTGNRFIKLLSLKVKIVFDNLKILSINISIWTVIMLVKWLKDPTLYKLLLLSSLKGNYWGNNIGAWCQRREENSGKTNHPEEEHGRGVLWGAVPGPRLSRGQWRHILHVSVHIIVSISYDLPECIHWFEFLWRKSF